MAGKPGSVKRAMPWLWMGYDRRGKCHEGLIWAETETIARARLKQKHIQVVSVQRCLRWQMGHVSAREMSLCIRQLATLVQVGLSLLQCFDVLISSTTHRALNHLLNDMRNHVASGSPLSDAFRRWPRYFDAFFCYLVAASESIGGLDISLQRLATHMEKRLSVRNKIRTALVYPAIVILAGLCITTIILTTVIPLFRDLFNSLGAQLPVTTLLVLGFSEWLASWYLLLLGIVVGLTITLICLWRCNEAFRASVVHLVACFPLIGSFIRKAYLARWARTLSALLGAGIPLIEALEPVAKSTGDRSYVNKIPSMIMDLGTGLPFSQVLQRSRLFPNMVVHMVTVGEEAGDLEQILDKIADYYDIEFDNAVALFIVLIEPAMMLFLGTLVGSLVLTMYLPILDIGHII